MATKKCASEHCEATFEAKGARKFCDLHAPVKLIKSGTSRKPLPVTANADLTAFLVPLYVTEPQLDDFWAKLPIEEKALAVQLFWDNQNA